MLFFVTRTTHYLTATAAITLLVLMCFNQATGAAHGLILPRLLDTMIGSAIAAVAMLWVLPDWQGRRLAAVAAQAPAAHAHYLREILSQYATGKADDLDYRLARRNAHNADAAFSTTLSHLLQEPRHVRSHSLAGMRMLVASHTLLSYLSALGAHRAGPAGPAADLAQEAGAHAAERLESLAAALRRQEGAALEDAGRAQALAAALEQAADAMALGGDGGAGRCRRRRCGFCRRRWRWCAGRSG